LDRRCIEDQAVLRLDMRNANFPHYGRYSFNVIVSMPQEIDIHRGTEERRLPHRQHQGTLQNELVRELRLVESVQEALHREILDQFTEGTPGLTRFVEEPLPDRRPDVLCAWLCH
jgi:hypothetical protein